MNEIIRLRENALRTASVKCDVSVNLNGDVVLRAANCTPAYTVNLTLAIQELVDERIDKAIQKLKALDALDKARGGPDQ
jgi:ribosome-associated translation inhibitor RaiA